MYEAQNLPLPANNPETNLAWAVSQSQALGWRVESATPRFVTMVAEGKQTNHVLHLLLTLATCGLWGYRLADDRDHESRTKSADIANDDCRR